MKPLLIKSIGMSLLSPIIIGSVLGLYYGVLLEQPIWSVFVGLLMSAIANAHIVGLAMAAFVVPGYLLMHKYNKVQYSAVLTLGMLGGAVFSHLLTASSGGGFVVNTIMAALAAGLFLFSLRRFA
ncbi:hypothetical protein [Pseudoalteromonas aurantia]|uniref:Uncharacterized protein n=1 Tax=Pseudoalteromonas aurantia TaxID=43654 RepID=A0ABY2VWZ7_9GAMM|nr:hypothetical protein [Pseudoalteromonas aurantia]TMO65686.1 hypothetical protein CWC18_04380 [Pseudoalteromonas aurantia]TMO74041.1 hypothetical protein CWC20_11450 [Pseudoalteromonas aurantia]